MDHDYENARLCFRVDQAAMKLVLVENALTDRGRRDLATQASELVLDLLHFRRQLLDLPGDPSVPPPVEDDLNASAQDVPF